MRVLLAPGTWREQESELADAMLIDTVLVDPDDARQVYAYANEVDHRRAQLTALLVERGVITLSDCRTLGGPLMERKP